METIIYLSVKNIVCKPSVESCGSWCCGVTHVRCILLIIFNRSEGKCAF